MARVTQALRVASTEQDEQRAADSDRDQRGGDHAECASVLMAEGASARMEAGVSVTALARACRPRAAHRHSNPKARSAMSTIGTASMPAFHAADQPGPPVAMRITGNPISM